MLGSPSGGAALGALPKAPVLKGLPKPSGLTYGHPPPGAGGGYGYGKGVTGTVPVPRAPQPPKPPTVLRPSPPTAGAPATTGAPSPYDATYYQQLNNATLAANNKINGYDTASGYAASGLQGTLQQLAYNQNLAVQKAQNAENARGGFAQGALGQTIGTINHSYLSTESGDVLKADEAQAARDAAVAAVRSGLSLEQAAFAAASAARATKAAAANKALGVNLPKPPAAGGTAAGTAAPGRAPAGRAGFGSGTLPSGTMIPGNAPGRHVGPGPAGKYTYYGANGKPVLGKAPGRR